MMRILSAHRVRIVTFALSFLAGTLQVLAQPNQAPVSTLDRIRQSGKFTIGYEADARPFSYRDPSGKAAGYSVALCQRIAEQVKAKLQLSNLTVDWEPVNVEERFHEVQQGKVDLLCGADTDTLTRRKDVDFSISIFPGGLAALVRSDASDWLREVLTRGLAVFKPFWRASATRLLEQQTFSVVRGTTSEQWLASEAVKFQISANVLRVDTFEAGVQRVLDGTASVFFGERAILLDAANRSASPSDLIVLDRQFTNEPKALALRRCDDDFRLIIDQTLSQLFTSADFRPLYLRWFGEPTEFALNFFTVSALPQ